MPQLNNMEKQAHILIVDDEFSNRILLQRVLNQWYQITEAENGQQTLDLLESESFDLILLDIMMPDVSGLKILRHIRQTRATADLPVILISALDRNDDIVEGLQVGANDYIVKPIDVDIVLARVETQLQIKRTADLQKQVIAELEAAQKLKDRLLRIASHDLKSPLMNVGLAESLLREMIGEAPEVTVILDQVHSTVKQMNQVIEDFLEMSAYQGGELDLDLSLVEIDQIITDVIRQYNLAAIKKNIGLEVHELPGTIQADAERLSQILSNLVSNAIKYSPPETTVRVWSEIVNEAVRISIADEGPGIPLEERSKLFTEFGKLSNRPTGGESSTGMGLWIVKHLITLHMGEIGVDCPSDGGSVFWVEFPVAVE